MNQQKIVEWVLRVGIAGTFLGHGAFAFGVKTSWVPFLTYVGFSSDTAVTLMPIIGVMDVIIAIFALIKPIRIVLVWAVVWAFSTALMRPLTGAPIWDFVERAANWAAPLALLALQGFPKSIKNLFTVR